MWHLFGGCLRRRDLTEVRSTKVKGIKLKQFKGILVARGASQRNVENASHNPVAFVSISQVSGGCT